MRAEAPRELIARARHDRAAFAELYDFYLPRVFAFCRLQVGTREEAEDLTAHTFERALAAIGRYEDRGAPFSSWLLRIAANAAADRVRRGAHVPVVDSAPEPIDGDSRLSHWERAIWLNAHLEALPRDQQEVVRLRFYEDQTFSDIAARMGRSDGAVKQLLRRALKTLQQRIESEAQTDV